MPDPAAPPSDWADTLAAARAGSPAALGRLLDFARPYLLAVAADQLETDLQAKAGASDLVQQSLLEGQQDFAAFSGRAPDEVIAWLRQILLNNLADLRRRYRATEKRDVTREVSLPEPWWGGLPGDQLAGDSTSPSGTARRNEDLARLEAAVRHLPDDCRAVVEWRQRDGVPFEEIGRRLGRSAEGARQLWWRALVRLRRDLGDAR